MSWSAAVEAEYHAFAGLRDANPFVAGRVQHRPGAPAAPSREATEA